MWRHVADRVNLSFGNQRSAYACITFWQRKLRSCLAIKEEASDCLESSAQMGQVNVVDSSASISRPTGSRKGQTRTPDRHSSDAHPDKRGQPATEAKRETGGSQEPRADSSSPVADDDNWQVNGPQASTSLFSFPRTSTRYSFM